MVYEELLRIAEAACPKDLSRFPQLQRRLAQAVLDFIQARRVELLSCVFGGGEVCNNLCKGERVCR
jgi:hypothetical protein